MICTKCGFQNSVGDEFCGNCGTFLEWSGEAESPTEPVAAEPTLEAAPAQPSPTDITQPVPTPPITQAAGAAVVCWNCGRQNPVGRSFCQQCGERLEVAAASGAIPTAGAAGAAVAGASGGGGGRRSIAIAIGVIALLLLAGGAAAIFLGGLSGGAGPTPTSAALSSGDASPSTEPSSSASARPSAAG